MPVVSVMKGTSANVMAKFLVVNEVSIGTADVEKRAVIDTANLILNPTPPKMTTCTSARNCSRSPRREQLSKTR